MTRRGLLVQGSLALAAYAACRPGVYGTGGNLSTVWPRQQELLTAPVEVPRDFVGMHAHRWPAGNPVSPEPTYSFGAARSHDYDGAAWYRIHLAPGVFDWRRLDAWVDVHTAAKRTLIYTLYGTPAWAASTTVDNDVYGEPGGAAPPQDQRPVEEFILALVERYNGGGAGRIRFIEVWNEPAFSHRREDFWWGTAGELAEMGRTVARSAKRIDPHIRILSPGFNGNLAGALTLRAPSLEDAQGSPVYQYLMADDGSGGTAAQWCDGIAFHCYDAPSSGPNRCFAQEILRLREMLRLMAVSAPLYDTEFGYLADDPFHRLPPTEQAKTLRRCAAVQAALGVQALYLYAHDDALVGNPSLHPEVAVAIGDVNAMIAGNTLEQVTLHDDGSIAVRTAHRAFLW